MDIDECESSDVLCESQQYCYNTLGSYKCLDILLPSGSEASVDNSPKKCSDGLRHNAKTDECDGKSHKPHKKITIYILLNILTLMDLIYTT